MELTPLLKIMPFRGMSRRSLPRCSLAGMAVCDGLPQETSSRCRAACAADYMCL